MPAPVQTADQLAATAAAFFGELRRSVDAARPDGFVGIVRADTHHHVDQAETALLLALTGLEAVEALSLEGATA